MLCAVHAYIQLLASMVQRTIAFGHATFCIRSSPVMPRKIESARLIILFLTIIPTLAMAIWIIWMQDSAGNSCRAQNMQAKPTQPTRQYYCNRLIGSTYRVYLVRIFLYLQLLYLKTSNYLFQIIVTAPPCRSHVGTHAQNFEYFLQGVIF